MAEIKNFAARAIALVAAALALTVASCSKGLDATYEESQQVVPPADSTTQVSEPFGYLVKNEESKIRIIRKDDTYFDYNYDGFGLEARPDTIKRNASEGVKLLTTEQSVEGNDTLRFDLSDTYSEVLAKGILVNYSEQNKSYTLVPMMGIKVKADLKVINSEQTKFNFYELARVKFELWSDKSSVAQAKLLATDSIFVVTNFAAEMPADTTMVSWSESDKAVSAKVVTVLSGDTTVANYSLDKLHKLYAEELKEIKTDNLNFSSENSLTLSSTEKGNWDADDSGKLQAQVIVEKYNHKNSHRTNVITRESYHEFVLKVNGKTFTYESKPEAVVFMRDNIGQKSSDDKFEYLPVESVYRSSWKGDVVEATQQIKLIKEKAVIPPQENERAVEVKVVEKDDKVAVEVIITNTVNKEEDKNYKREISKIHEIFAEDKKEIEDKNLDFSSDENLSLSSTTEGEWVYDDTKELKAQILVKEYIHKTSDGDVKVSQKYLGNFTITVDGESYNLSVSAPAAVKRLEEKISSKKTTSEKEILPVELVYGSTWGGWTEKASQFIDLYREVEKQQNEQTVNVSWSETETEYVATVSIKNTVDTDKDATYTRKLAKVHSLETEAKKTFSSENFNFASASQLSVSSSSEGDWQYDSSKELKAQLIEVVYSNTNSHCTNKVVARYLANFELVVDGETYKNSFSAPEVAFVKDVIGSETTVGENIILPVEVVYSSVLGGETITATQEIEISKAAPKQNEQKIEITSEDKGESVEVTVKITNTVDTQNDKTYTLSLSKDHSVKAEDLKRIETSNFSTTYNGLALQSTTPGNWVYDATGELKAQQFVRTFVHSTTQGNHQITQSYNGNFVVTINGVEYPISLSEPTLNFSQERKGSAQMSGEMVEVPVSLDYSSVYGKSTKNATQEIVLYANAISFAGEKILVVSRTDAYNANMSAPEGTYDCVLSETATGYNFRYRKVGATNWTVLSLATADGERLLAMNKALAVFKGSPWDAGCVEVAADNNKSIIYYRYDYTGATDSMGFPIGRYAIDVVNSTFDGEKGDPIKGYAVMKSGENLLQMKIDGNGSLFFINL